MQVKGSSEMQVNEKNNPRGKKGERVDREKEREPNRTKSDPEKRSRGRRQEIKGKGSQGNKK